MVKDYYVQFKPNSELDEDKWGDLTVKGARDVLDELVANGYGDFELLIGYDSNLAYTGFTDNIRISEMAKKVCVDE